MYKPLLFLCCFMVLGALLPGCDLSGEKNDAAETGGDGSEDHDDEDCVDQDQDNWCEQEDCNDFNGSVYPGAIEECFDLIDNDCDFLIDEEDPDCADAGSDGT